jgi:WD40 repeat protein
MSAFNAWTLTRSSLLLPLLVAWMGSAAASAQTKPIEFARDVAPIFARYCTGCHNREDLEGDLSLESYDEIRKGLDTGPLVLPGQPESSHLIRVLSGETEPKMPPGDRQRPSAEELALLKTWIEAGARGPGGESPIVRLITPRIEPAARDTPPTVTAVAASPSGRQLAIGRFGCVEIVESGGSDPARRIADLPGKVHALSYSADGDWLVVATGINGLEGRAEIYETEAFQRVRSFTGHRDSIYDAVLSPDKRRLATCSYDHAVMIWDVASGNLLHTLTGHNGAVFDLAFSPDGGVLASASADETIKLWSVETGQRLDSLTQPEGPQYAVAFSPDGGFVVAGGGDRRIRVWRFVSREQAQINPLLHTRFAHDGAVVALAFSPDGRTLVSAADDRTLRAWETAEFSGSRILDEQPDVVTDLAISSDSESLIVGRFDGTWQAYPIQPPAADPATGRSSAGDVAEAQPPATLPTDSDRQPVTCDESEPNSSGPTAQPIELPAVVRGRIFSESGFDEDWFRFRAVAGQTWLVEIDAARSGSPLDSKVEILDRNGKPVPRVVLQAVRESYFTFRGKNSTTSDDFRVHNWEEMSLDDYLYAAGEVVQLWKYPRGPDSGFMVYPGQGSRWNYFDTTAVSHALNEPCWIVRPHPPGAALVPNGLPVFPVNYENDDDSLREWGADSRLTFTAPTDGEYWIRVTDVRGFFGEAFSYSLTVRSPRPDFQVACELANESIPAGGGREFRVSARRLDGFPGEIRVEVTGLPTGFYATSPVLIEPGQLAAYGVIHAPRETAPVDPHTEPPRFTAVAVVGSMEVRKEIQFAKKLTLGEPPRIVASIQPSSGLSPESVELKGAGARQPNSPGESPTETSFSHTPWELTVSPGETISAVVRIERHGDFQDEVQFGTEDAGRNLPHGVFIDNVGLNGLLINREHTEREFFITAVQQVPETSRLFHLKARVDGDLATLPVLLHVRRKPDSTGADSAPRDSMSRGE